MYYPVIIDDLKKRKDYDLPYVGKIKVYKEKDSGGGKPYSITQGLLFDLDAMPIHLTSFSPDFIQIDVRDCGGCIELDFDGIMEIMRFFNQSKDITEKDIIEIDDE